MLLLLWLLLLVVLLLLLVTNFDALVAFVCVLPSSWVTILVHPALGLPCMMLSHKHLLLVEPSLHPQ